jgi:hypothetical protein
MKGTHQLYSAGRGIGQVTERRASEQVFYQLWGKEGRKAEDMEGKLASKGGSLPVDRGEGRKSGHCKASKQTRGTHHLSREEGRKSNQNRKKEGGEGTHSLLSEGALVRPQI